MRTGTGIVNYEKMTRFYESDKLKEQDERFRTLFESLGKYIQLEEYRMRLLNHHSAYNVVKLRAIKESEVREWTRDVDGEG